MQLGHRGGRGRLGSVLILNPAWAGALPLPLLWTLDGQTRPGTLPGAIQKSISVFVIVFTHFGAMLALSMEPPKPSQLNPNSIQKRTWLET